MKATNEPNDSGPNEFPFYCAIAVGAAVIFAILYWPSIRGYYLTAQASKVSVMPPSEGGGETLESVDPSKGSGRVVRSDAPASIEDVQALSGKVTGTITTDPNPTPITGNFSVSSNLTIQKHKNITLHADSFETITIPGHHVITQAEAEEVVKALSIATRQAEPVQFGVTHAVYLTPAAQAQETANRLAREEAELSEAKATLAKWRKRVEEGKP